MAEKDKTKNSEENKDYIINLRVSRETYEKIKDRAIRNKDTVSSLIRRIIDDSGDSIRDLSRDIFGEKKTRDANETKKDFNDIVGYYEIELARDIECAKCDKVLKKDEKVIVGETETGRRYYFCAGCGL